MTPSCARLGSPVHATQQPVNGNVQVDGAGGEADVEVELAGPKGRARFAVEADRKSNVWTLRRVAARIDESICVSDEIRTSPHRSVVAP